MILLNCRTISLKMFRLITAVLLISACTGNNSEKQCSRYHYEEQILAKIVRMEHRLEQLEKMNIEKGTSSPNPTCTQCPDTWISFDGSCYNFVEEKLTFSEAVLHCVELSAHIVHVESKLENIFLKSHLNGLKDANYWMGLTDTDIEGTFKWYGTDKIASFTDWIGSQPDNSQGKEHCVHFHINDFKWNDSICWAKFKSVCEKKQTSFQ